jgi:hypothetical protein
MPSPNDLISPSGFPYRKTGSAFINGHTHNALVKRLERTGAGTHLIRLPAFDFELASFGSTSAYQLLGPIIEIAETQYDPAVLQNDDRNIKLPYNVQVVGASAQFRTMAGTGAGNLLLNLIKANLNSTYEVNVAANHILNTDLKVDAAHETDDPIDVLAGSADALEIVPIIAEPAGGITVTMADAGIITDVATVAVTGDATNGYVIALGVDDTASTGTKLQTLIMAINTHPQASQLVQARKSAASTLTTVIDQIIPSTVLAAYSTSVDYAVVKPSLEKTVYHPGLTGLQWVVKKSTTNVRTDRVQLTLAVRVVDHPLGGVVKWQ